MFRDSTLPYEYQFLMLNRVITLSLGATAFDFDGLSGSAAPVVISVPPVPGDSDGDGFSDAYRDIAG